MLRLRRRTTLACASVRECPSIDAGGIRWARIKRYVCRRGPRGRVVNRLNRVDRRRFTQAYLALYEEVGNVPDRHD